VIESLVTPTTGATGILAVVVFLILLGRLVPKSTLDSLRQDKDQQIQLWHQAYQNALAALSVEREYTETLIGLVETTIQRLGNDPEQD